MVFVANDLTAWLVGLLADAGRKKLVVFVLGTEQDRALRRASQLNHDQTHLLAENTLRLGNRVEGKVDQLLDLLVQLLTVPGQADPGMPIPRQLPPDDVHFTGRGRRRIAGGSCSG